MLVQNQKSETTTFYPSHPVDSCRKKPENKIMLHIFGRSRKSILGYKDRSFNRLLLVFKDKRKKHIVSGFTVEIDKYGTFSQALVSQLKQNASSSIEINAKRFDL